MNRIANNFKEELYIDHSVYQALNESFILIQFVYIFSMTTITLANHGGSSSNCVQVFAVHLPADSQYGE